jgi:hypothetical protein
MTFFVIHDMAHHNLGASLRLRGDLIRKTRGYGFRAPAFGRPRNDAVRGQRIDDVARIDDGTLIGDVARTLGMRFLNLIQLSNSPTQTCVIVRSQRTASSLRLRSSRKRSPANENDASNDFAYCPVKGGSNDRQHNRDHKKYRRPEQQIIAIE